jgi:effector-binding domain-containing protein
LWRKALLLNHPTVTTITGAVDYGRPIPMKYDVVVETAQAELVAAVRATVPIINTARAWKPALDQVWAFLKANGELDPGHNLFLYHHPERRNEAMSIDFGVQVVRPFDGEGKIRCVETPAGEVTRTVHVGPYDRLGDAHDAIHAWCAANNRKIAHASWEIYGDRNNDPALLETTIKYLLV